MLYLCILLLLLIHSYLFDFHGFEKGKQGWFIAYYFIFILIAGLRYKVGGDTLSYMTYYEDIPPLSQLSIEYIVLSGRGFLWILLSSFAKTINNDFVVFQIIHAIILQSAIFYFFKKYSYYRFCVLTLYYFFSFLYFNTEILRESLALAFFLFAYPSLENKKYLKYYILALIGVLFHTSAILILFLPLFTLLKLSKRTVLLAIFILSIIFYFQESIYNLILTDSNLLKARKYSSISANINGLVVNGITYLLVPGLLLKFLYKYATRPKFSELYFAYFFISFMVVIIPGFNRFINYLIPFIMVVFVDILQIIWRLKKFKQVRQVVIFIIICIVSIPKLNYYFEDTSKYYRGTRRYNRWYPYSSVISKEEYIPREILYREAMRDLNVAD